MIHPIDLELLCVERDDWFLTATGRVCFVEAPEISDYSIDDIAIALSRLNRFFGHTRRELPAYSVAQHSVLVSYNVPAELALAGLLHDAPEAMLGDIIRPLKRSLAPIYRPLERKWASDIGHRFGLGIQLLEEDPRVKAADNDALMTERRDLVLSGPRPWSTRGQAWPERLEPWTEFEARFRFLTRFHALTDGRFKEPNPFEGMESMP